MHIRFLVAAAVAFLMGTIVGVQAAGTFTVVQRALVFGKASLSPANLSPAKGDRITFTNEDDVIHNIHIFGPGDDQKDLGLQKRDAQLHLRPGRLLHGPLQHPSVKMAVTAK
jgi:plastocyanin